MLRIKRILSLVLSLAMVLTCVPAQVFATEVCDHSYDAVVTEAGCVEEGSVVYTCTACGDSYEETVAAAGHNYVQTDSVEAACSTPGSVTYTCDACGDSYVEETPAGEHTYEAGACTVCGEADPDAQPAEEPTETPVTEIDEDPVEATEEVSTEVPAEPAYVASGTCGESLTWTLDGEGTLTISGTGAMKDYSNYNTPWYNYRSSIQTVIVEKGVTSIGNSAFQDCDSLTSITLPEGITNIGEAAFYDCDSLTSVVLSKGVTSIGVSAFYGCNNLTSVTLPDGITSIGDHAFSYCSSLTGITLPEGVTSICDYAFAYCSILTNITLPEGVASIGYRAFYECSSLTSVTLPESLTEIGKDAFYYCSNLTDIYIANIAAWAEGYGNTDSHPLNRNQTINLYLDGEPIEELVIPAGVTYIAYGAFRNCGNLTSVTIPEGVTSIGNYAFSSCSSLTDIVIPEGVTSIGGYAFQNCSSLSSITLPESLAEIHSDAFWNCNNITEIYITNIAAWAENYGNPDYSHPVNRNNGNGQLINLYLDELPVTNVVIPEGVTYIGYNAFQNISSLRRVTLPSSVTTIDAYAFYNCSGMTKLTLAEGLTTIGNRAFYGCASLRDVVIPEGVTSIEYYAFGECSELETVALPSSLTTIAEGAFGNCRRLESVDLPAGITEIAGSTFGGCSNLESVTLPDTLTTIGNSAFSGCAILPVIDLPDSVTAIGYSAFSGCDGLTSITIPEGVTSIGNSVFYGCDNLSTVVLPDSLVSIGTHAFYDSGITTITIPKGIAYLEDSTFGYCNYLETVNLPDGLLEIGTYAFHGCRSLKSITLPDSITDIGNYAFYGCDGLVSIVLPVGLTRLEENVFYYCTNLESVTLPQKLARIYKNAFQSCVKLTSIEFPASLTRLDANIFSGCSKLTDITFNGNAPQFHASTFTGVTADAVYPASNATWTSDKLQDYGGTINWISSDAVVTPDPSDPADMVTVYITLYLDGKFVDNKPVSVPVGTMMDADTVKAQAAQNLYPEYFTEDYVYVGVEGGGLAEDISSVRIYFETKSTPTEPVCDHMIRAWTPNGDGTHSASCYCGLEKHLQACSFGSDNVCSVCGGKAPSNPRFDYRIEVRVDGVAQFSKEFAVNNLPDEEAIVAYAKADGDISAYFSAYASYSVVDWTQSSAAIDFTESITEPKPTEPIAVTTLYIEVKTEDGTKIGSTMQYNEAVVGETYDADDLFDLVKALSGDDFTGYEAVSGSITISADKTNGVILVVAEEEEPTQPTQPTEPAEPADALTFKYKNANGNWTTSVATIKNGDYIKFPELPSVSGLKHTGWKNDEGEAVNTWTKWYEGMSREYIATYVESTDDGLVDLTVYAYYYVDGEYHHKAKLFVEEFEESKHNNMVPWIYSNGVSKVKSALAAEHGADGYQWDPTVFYNCYGDGEISTWGDLKADGNQSVYVKINSQESTEATILLHIHTKQEYAIARTIKMAGYNIGNAVTFTDVLTMVGNHYTGDNMTMSNLYDAGSWEDLMNGQGSAGATTIKVAGDTVEIHVILTDAAPVSPVIGTVKQNLNVRSAPSTTASVVKTLEAGTQVEILKTQTVMGMEWGLIADGWILMTYVDLGDGSGSTDNTCGDNLTWSFDKDTGILTISGTGAMYDYEQNKTPWEGIKEQIQQVVIEQGVTSVGECAFLALPALRTVTIPESVKNIAWGAFGGKSSMQSFKVDAENKYYTAEKGVLFNKDKTVLIQYPCDKTDTYYSVPGTVTEIAIEAFRNCDNLSAVNLPKSLQTIAHFAFYGCDGLREIRIPNSVTELGMTVFSNCTSLQKVVVGSGVMDLGVGAFENCTSLAEVQLPDTLVNIWENAFAGCTSLKTIHLPAGMTYFCTGAFHDCTALEEIIIGGVQEIYWPFENCTALKNVYFRGDAPTYSTDAFQTLTLNAYYPAENATWTEEVMQSFGGNITWIPVATSGDCGDSVTWSYDANTRTLIISGNGDMADYPDSAPWAVYGKEIINLVIENGVTGIGDFAFRDCEALYHASFPASLVRIGESAFPKVEWSSGDGTTEIYDLIFWSEIDQTVRQWSTVQMEKGSVGFLAWDNTTFRNDAPIVASGIFGSTMYWELDDAGIATIFGTGNSYEFWATGSQLGNYPVKSIVIEAGVSGINLNAFEGLMVENVTIASTVKTIETMVFADCQSLNTITFLGDAPAFGENCFRNVTATAFYPADNATWTEEVMGDYEGNITWIPIGTVENRVTVLLAELDGQTSVWIDGKEYAAQIDGDMAYVDLPNSKAKTMVVHTYHVGDPDDVHTQYPIGMKVWMLTNTNGYYSADRTEVFDDILQYSGMSIRVFGKKGIRMITSIEQEKKDALVSYGLEGYTLKEYGTVIAWDSQISANKPLVLGASYVSSNYAYKQGIADPVFKYTGNMMQYTNVLVNFTNDQCKDDIALRPYMILEDENGNQVTIYGGILRRSIGYIALQNRKDVFEPGSDAYEYIWEIIRYVYGTQYDKDYIVSWSPPAM